MEIDRSTIFNKIKQLEMSLEYFRDAIMTTFLSVPVDLFFELKGNLPMAYDDRMKLLEHMLVHFDIEYLKGIQHFIVDSNDKELAEYFCNLDLKVWQLMILSYRYADKHDVIVCFSKIADELIQILFSLKQDILGKDFFDFDAYEVVQMTEILSLVSEKNEQTDTEYGKYVGWDKLESAVDKFGKKYSIIKDATFIRGKFSLKSPVQIEKIYEYLLEYKINSGKFRGKSVVYPEVSFEDFSFAVYRGDYSKLREHCILDKLFCFICLFSASYISDTKVYRVIAAASLHTKLKNLQSYNLNRDYAEGLKKCIPLIRFNKV